MAVSNPNSVAFRPSVFLIGMPITPNIIQTMKQTVNASVLTISTDHAFFELPGSEAMLRSTHTSRARHRIDALNTLVFSRCG